MENILKNRQYYKFCFYGFLKNLRFFDAFFILFLIEKGLNFTQIGTLYALREITTNLFEIPSGIIADNFGRKRSLIASLLVYIISFLIFYISDNYWLFFFAFLFYGIAEAFRSGTHKGILMDYLKINKMDNMKIAYYGHTRSWSQKGAALSSLIAGIIIFYNGSYEMIFLYSIIPYVINFLLIMSYPGELDKSTEQSVRKEIFSIKATVKELFSVIRKPEVFSILNTSATHSAYLKAVKDYIQPVMVNVIILIPLLQDTEIEKKNGLFIGIMYFLIYLITSRASRMASQIAGNREKSIALTTLLLGFSSGIICGILYGVELWILALIAFMGIYIIENIRKPILTGFISDNTSNEILTSVLSVQSQWKTIITALLSVSFGILSDAFGIGAALAGISSFLMIWTFIIKAVKERK
ncbi:MULTISPECIES: MFS transporter [unclassified Oceanispirochaeta]|uniref:MFS transporter n=1 Tax=unclassified Oceanispirochaeta TaxID=2635722 RepID=UPI000E091D41|nr:MULTISPECIES: MFS transporter [unclassified Oceanispirochaeta]MBF9014143.1 MFS transporter [Oceanispirochaeta sp. M2]NPD70633.1 MFS transporter [Oceanispirochaeta sp. M1]RDG34397.1 MFS transporter [Oceanispirochaeta sp. M1]